MDTINTLFRCSVEQLTSFLENPNDAYTRDNFLDTMERLWYKWAELYYIHISDYLDRKETGDSGSILMLPSYVRYDVEQLKTAVNKFGSLNYDMDKLTIGEKITILAQIEEKLDDLNKTFIKRNADLLARLQAFREMAYPEKSLPKDDSKVIPFQKDDR